MSLVIFLSDLHIIEGTEDEEQRLLDIVDDAAHIESAPPIVHVAVGGDCIEGTDIHRQQNAMVHIPAREQVNNALRLFKKFILKLRKAFPNAQIIITWVGGNHGRTSHTAHPSNNWDIELGQRLANWVYDREMPDIVVRVQTRAWHAKFQVHHTVFYMIHKIGGKPTHLETNARKGVIYERLMQHKADVVLLGHYHRGTHHCHQNGTLKLVVNGAFSECEPFYREENGYWSRPGQAIIMVPEEGVPMEEDVHWARWD